MQMEFSAREIPSHEKTAEYRQIKTLRSCMNLNKRQISGNLVLKKKECRCYIFDKKDLSGSLILRNVGDRRWKDVSTKVFGGNIYERCRDKDPGDPSPDLPEVARMAYHTEWPVDKRIEELPYKIIPGEVGNFRNDVFLERAIVKRGLRLAMGLPYRGASGSGACLNRDRGGGQNRDLLHAAAAHQRDQILRAMHVRKSVFT